MSILHRLVEQAAQFPLFGPGDGDLLSEQSGREEEALGFYAQIGARSPFELTLTWQAELGMARIHEKRGNSAVAARYYRSVAARLKNADAALQQARQSAEDRAVALLPLDRRGWF